MPTLNAREEFSRYLDGISSTARPLKDKPSRDPHGTMRRVTDEISYHDLLIRAMEVPVEGLEQLDEAILILNFVSRTCARLQDLRLALQTLRDALTSFRKAVRQGASDLTSYPAPILVLANDVRTLIAPPAAPST